MSSRSLHTGARYLRRTWAVLLLLLLPTISGCAEAAIPAEPVTIAFAYATSDHEYYEPLVQEFNESHPYITVELGSASGDDADVFIITPFDLSELLAQDAILSMDPFIEQDESFDLSDFYPGTVELCTREGELWAIPAGVDVTVLYYNQDLFDEYDVPYPELGWTWDDFLTSALALRDPAADVFGYAIIQEFIDPLPFIYQHGGRILDDLENPTRTTFDDPSTIEALEWYAGLIHEHDVVPGPDQAYDLGGSVESGVYLGKVGMWTGWLTDRGGGGGVEATWPAEWKMRWGMVPLPRDVRSATLTFVVGYAISRQSTQPDACWQWIAFLSRQVRAPYGLTPARRSLAESSAYEQFVGSDVASIARVSMENALLLSPSLVEFIQPYVYGTAIDAIISGRSTPEEALTRAQQQAER